MSPNFIRVHSPSGETVFVNVDHILEVRGPNPSAGAVIESEGPDQHRDVQESPEEVLALIEATDVTLLDKTQISALLTAGSVLHTP